MGNWVFLLMFLHLLLFLIRIFSMNTRKLMCDLFSANIKIQFILSSQYIVGYQYYLHFIIVYFGYFIYLLVYLMIAD